MRVLVTGHEGYIGAVMVPFLLGRGIEVTGLDSGLFQGCDFGPGPDPVPCIRRDLRDVRLEDLEGLDAVIHLAAISNDPLGNLNPACTYEINHRASTRLAELARRAGVERFLYSSSCSVYGAASPDEILTEEATFSPITPYAESKVRVEADLLELADDHFSPVFLRNATVYGPSPRLRGDLVVNNLVGWAHTTGRILLKSDGTPWRPLVHVEDVARAFLAALLAERSAVHAQAFNVGRGDENYRIMELAEMTRDAIPDSRIEVAEGAGPDPRCYRVSFEKIQRELPAYRPARCVPEGITELLEAFRRQGLEQTDLEGSRYVRVMRIEKLIEQGRLDGDLRWRTEAPA